MNWKEYKVASSTQMVGGVESAEYIPTVDEIIYSFLSERREADIKEISAHICELTGMTYKDVRNNVPNTLAAMRKKGLVHNGAIAGFWCFGKIAEGVKAFGNSRISLVVVAPRVPNGRTYLGFTFGRSGRILVDALGNILPPAKYYVVGSYKGARHSVMIEQSYMSRHMSKVYCQSGFRESDSFTQEFKHCAAYYEVLSKVAELLDTHAVSDDWTSCAEQANHLCVEGKLSAQERDDILFTIAREKRDVA